MNNIFKFDDRTVRVFVINDEILFSGVDVAKALGYAKPERAIEQHTKKGVKYKKSEHSDLGGSRIPNNGLTLIPESDLYRLILKSNLPSAERFQDWVVDVVLPSIRKTGSYSLVRDKSWLQARSNGKIVRREETDVIKVFVEYATAQGSTNAGMYYMTITKGVYSALYILEKGAGWKGIRETLGTTDLQVLSTCEHVAKKYIQEGMDLNMHYKDIYQYAIAKVEEMAKIIGRKEIKTIRSNVTQITKIEHE